MKVAFYTIYPSTHQFPLAREIIARVGEENFRYVYEIALMSRFSEVKPTEDELNLPRWCVSDKSEEGKAWLASAEVLLSGERDVALFERRAKAGLKTIYSAERWFKPPVGFGRMLHPRYFAMAWRFMRLVRKGFVTCLPMGIWAARDLARVDRLFCGDVRCLFRAPRLAFESEPMGRIASFSWMHMWGYFVAPRLLAQGDAGVSSTCDSLRILWAGHYLDWKHAETIVLAAYAVLKDIKIAVTLVGEGPEQVRLQELSRRLARSAGVEPVVLFHPSVSYEGARELMRRHDVFVLASDGYEGWGAVVSEALEENMEVFGTYEAGSSATILPGENLHHAGDWATLAQQLVRFATTGKRFCHGVGKWSAAFAAETFMRQIAR